MRRRKVAHASVPLLMLSPHPAIVQDPAQVSLPLAVVPRPPKANQLLSCQCAHSSNRACITLLHATEVQPRQLVSSKVTGRGGRTEWGGKEKAEVPVGSQLQLSGQQMRLVP